MSSTLYNAKNNRPAPVKHIHIDPDTGKPTTTVLTKQPGKAGYQPTPAPEPITFISAENGRVRLETASLSISSTDPAILANFIRPRLPLSAMASSSMDFASEYGFAHDDAADDLLDAAVALARETL